VEIITDDRSVVRVETLELLRLLVFVVFRIILKDFQSGRFVVSDNIAEVLVGVVLREGPRQLVVARVEQDVSVLAVVNNDFQSEEQQAAVFVDVARDVAELLVGVRVWDADFVDLVLLSKPVVIQPFKVRIILLLLQVLIRIHARLDQVGNQHDEPRTEATLSEQTQLHRFDADDLIILRGFILA